MTKQPDKDPAGRSASPRESGAKRPYRTPRLVAYGKLSDVAQFKGGIKADGPGNPASKA
jgi:hypothetical protein